MNKIYKLKYVHTKYLLAQQNLTNTQKIKKIGKPCANDNQQGFAYLRNM